MVEPGGRDRLWERDLELSVIRARLDAASAGDGSLLVIAGVAGIGKTSLLAAASTIAREDGTRVLRASGGPLETDFPYGIVRQLFESLRASCEPQQWAELTRGAAGLASIALDEPDRTGGQPEDVSHAAVHGLYWLAVNLAAAAPLLVCVDDLQWADPPSLRWLAYLARRLDGTQLTLAVAVRTGEPAVDPDVLAEMLGCDPAPLRPAPLGAHTVRQVVRARLGTTASAQFCSACLDVTGGNPFLLRALLSTLAAEGSSIDDAAASELSAFGAPEIARVLDRRLSRLPAGSRSVVEAVAVLGEDAMPQTTARLAELDPQIAVSVSDALRAAQVLRGTDPSRFAHPLLRSSVVGAIPPGRLAALHARAAAVLAATGAAADRVALHLLTVDPAADQDVVTTLRAAAGDAHGRGAPETAARYLRRALAEPPSPSTRADVLLELGLAEIATRHPDAPTRLHEAVVAFDEPVARAAAALAAAESLGYASAHIPAARITTTVLADSAGIDAECRRRLVVQGALNGVPSTRALAEEAGTQVERELALPPTGTTADAQLAAIGAMATVLHGDPAGGQLDDLAASGVFDGQASMLVTFGLMSLLATDRLDTAELINRQALATAEQAGSLGGVVHMRWIRAQIAYRRGVLADAEVDARSAYEYKLATTAVSEALPTGLAVLLDVLIERGELSEAERILTEADASEITLERMAATWLFERRGRLRRAQGRNDEAVADLQAAGDELLARGISSPSFCGWGADLALALAGTGDTEQAHAVASDNLQRSRHCDSVWATGIALRAVGVLHGPAGLPELRDSVEVLEASPYRLEHCRSTVELGAALRRGGNRAQARQQLREALDRAQRFGATGLAAHARAELLATGARPRRTELVGVAALTPRERQVARLAAERLTNRQIAQQLFVTERTVESHLLSAFGKLGINRRADLAPQLREQELAHT